MSEIAQASIPQQLQMLKEQTRLTGALHEAQVLQLKLWPLVVFQNAISSQFTWDPDKKVVIFTISHPAMRAKKAPKLDWWKERVTKLNEWVQVLLGDEWMIQVVAGKKTFNGSRKITNVGHRAPDAGAKGSAAH